MSRTLFEHYVGIDYSGAATPTSSLPGLRVYLAERSGPAVEVLPPPGPRKYWSRRGVAEWLVGLLGTRARTIVGIDHAFSFPKAYFDEYGLGADWQAFLEDFQRHWPTDGDLEYVDFVRDGLLGDGAARAGDRRWRRLTELAAGHAKSVFLFDVQGSVAKSTHAGLPWLLYLRRRLPSSVLFWPFDGWTVPDGASVIVEVYPALWNKLRPRGDRTPDQHDAWTVAWWLRDADAEGALEPFFSPPLTESERVVASVEGWILGVPSAATPVRAPRIRTATRGARRTGSATGRGHRGSGLARTTRSCRAGALHATIRAYAGDDDVWRVRDFLADLWGVTPPGRTWHVRRWDGCCFSALQPGLGGSSATRTRLWATPSGRIVAALLWDGGFEIHAHVHPDVQPLEDEVLAVGERLAADHGDDSVFVRCYDHDLGRMSVLRGRGYERTGRRIALWRLCPGGGQVARPKLPPGYRMRTTRCDDQDHRRVADLLNAGRERADLHVAQRPAFQRHAPSFRRELDLVAEAPDSTLAAHVALCWDGRNGRAVFEPMCTHPSHRKLGLAEALMREGIRRVRDLGALAVEIETDETDETDPADAPCDAIGFEERYPGEYWRKTLRR